MLRRRLRVLHLIAPTGLGGAERVLFTYLQHYNPEVVDPFLAVYLNSRRRENQFTYEADRSRIALIEIMIGKDNSFYKQLQATIRVIRTKNIDVVHSHGYRSDILGVISARIVGVPIVSTVHGWTPIDWKMRFYEMADRFSLRYFDHIICVSRNIFARMEQIVSRNKLTYMPNSVFISIDNDLLPAGLIKDKITFLYAGRLSPEKGLDVLLKAYAVLRRKFANTRLVILGEGSYLAEYQELAVKLKIKDDVFFLGHRSDIELYYNIADALVLPSRSEGLPMTLLEAMGRGLPVICTSVGGMPEVVIDGVTGLVVPPENPEALGAALCSLLEFPEKARSISDAGKRKVLNEYSIGPWVESIEKIYQSVQSS